MQRAIRYPAVEQRALLEEFDEERQLTERRTTTGPTDIRSITGCSPVGSPATPAFLAHSS
jgi:hypothetical protein